MENLKDIINSPWIIKIIWSSITIIISIFLYKILLDGIIKRLENGTLKLLSNKKTKTYIRLIKNITRYIFIVSTILIILEIYGINISSIIAGVGVIGVIFGLAIQDWLKDIIRGSSILSDNYFSVGDVVKYKDIEGKVLLLGLKTTKIQDLKTNNIISIANRNIDEIQILSNIIHIKIPLPYELKIKNAEIVIEQIVEKTKKQSNINDCKYVGVTELADSCIKYLLRVTCNPQYKLQAERDTLKSILLVLEDNKISVPYNQIDVHQK